MTTNSREFRVRATHALHKATAPVGELVSDDATLTLIAGLIDAKDEDEAMLLHDGELRTAWSLTRWTISAHGVQDRFFVSLSRRHEGEKPDTLTEVRSGYATAQDAVLDAKRVVTQKAFGDPEYRGVLGWRERAVLLVQGYYWLIIRTHTDGSIVFEYAEEPSDAYEIYAEACQKLAGEIEDQPGDDGMPELFGPKIVAAFIRREAAQMLVEQAKLALTVVLQGVEMVKKAYPNREVSKFNMSRFAVDLFTDAGDLKRAQDRKLRPKELDD